MRRLSVFFVAAIVSMGLVVVGCTQPAAAPAPTAAPAPAVVVPAPAKAPAEATKAPAVAPTAVPAKKVDYPVKGKAITMLVPYAPGGDTDLATRALASMLEADLGTPIEVVNRVGAGAQVAVTELAKAKPDGYTLASIVLPTTATLYLDPSRQAVFGRKDLLPLAMLNIDPTGIAVTTKGPYKSFKELIDAAKADPGKIRGGTSGILSNGDAGMKLLQKAAGVKFAIVNFDGAVPAMTALLGGNLEFTSNSSASFANQVKSGEMRVLGVMGTEESQFYPGVPTLAAQGYNVFMSNAGGIIAPAGMPKEIQDILGVVLKKAITSDEFGKKAKAVNVSVRYMDQGGFNGFWDQMETSMKPIVEELATKPAK